MRRQNQYINQCSTKVAICNGTAVLPWYVNACILCWRPYMSNAVPILLHDWYRTRPAEVWWYTAHLRSRSGVASGGGRPNVDREGGESLVRHAAQWLGLTEPTAPLDVPSREAHGFGAGERRWPGGVVEDPRVRPPLS